MKKFFYSAACAPRENEGGIQIFSSAMPEDQSKFPVMTGFIPMDGVSYMAFSRDRRFFYVVRNDSARQGHADVFRVEEDGGNLTLLASAETFGKSSCHLTTSPDDQFLYCANYSSGSFTEFKLKDGVFDGPGRVVEDQGISGPVASRQEHAHAHCSCFTPDGKYLCVVDLGTDSVFLYPYTPGKGIDAVPAFEYKEQPGQGPRHILFAPDGRHAWLINEVGNTVSELVYQDGRLVRRANHSIIPADFREYTKASAIRLSPNGRHLLATNRGHDSFAVFDVADDSSLTLREIISAEGISPRDINFLPCGKGIAACNETTNNTTYFSYDGETGAIRYLGIAVKCPKSLCLIS